MSAAEGGVWRVTKNPSRHNLDEALHESAIQISLVVEDDAFPVGFATARVGFR